MLGEVGADMSGVSLGKRRLYERLLWWFLTGLVS